MHETTVLPPPDVLAPDLSDGRPVVLIVDDTPDNLALLSDTLQAAGYAVLVALDGASALQRLARVTPDIVLLDALMPGMDGFETCRHIKADPRNRHLPVIFMTALTDSEHVVEGFRVGGIDYVTKPVKPNEVSARIGAHVERSRLHRQADMVLDLGLRAALIVTASGAIRWQSDLARRRLARYASEAAGPGRETGEKAAVDAVDAVAAVTAVDAAAAAGAAAGAAADVAAHSAASLAPLSAPSAAAGELLLPPPLAQWLSRWIASGGAQSTTFDTASGNVRHSARVLGSATRGEWVILLEEVDDDAQTQAFATRFGLTAREADVLLWLSHGKTNRDIGEILGMSPRTVNKHLEHVFAKLNVETRAAATALAVNAKGRHR